MQVIARMNANPESNCAECTVDMSVLANLPMTRRRMIFAWSAITLLYLAGVTWCWWPTPDSALYLSLGRSLAEGNGYVFNGEVSNTVTPGLPAALAGIRLCFGDTMLAANLFVALCGLAAIAMAYCVVVNLADRHTALAVAACLACSYTFYLSSHLVLTEAPTTMLVAMFLYCHVTRGKRPAWLTLCMLVLLAAACALVRAPSLGLLFIAAIGMLLDRAAEPSFRRRAISAAAVTLAVAAMVVGLYIVATAVSPETPLYVKTSTDSSYGGADIAERLWRTVPGMFLWFPEAMMEMFTGQSGGLLTAIIGLPMLAMMAAGAWRRWRAGSRLVPLLAILFPFGTSLLLGNWALRPRYLMPIQFLLLLLCMEGLLAAAAAVCRRFRKILSPQLARRVLEVFVILVIAFNIPRVAKISFGHGYWAVSGRFYEKVRGGDFVDIPAVKEFFANRPVGDIVIAAPADCRAIFHYLSRQKVVAFPTETIDGDRTVGDAEAIVKFVDSHNDIDLIVLDWDGGSQEFRSRLKKLVDADANFENIREMKQYQIYRRRRN